jgi:hypothetical protein
MKSHMETVSEMCSSMYKICGCVQCNLLREAAERRLAGAENEFRDVVDRVAETDAWMSQLEATLELERMKTEFMEKRRP